MSDSIPQEKLAYRQVFMSTSIFGGVQVFNILVGLLRAKIAAVLLGASGYGLINLYNVPLGFIGQITGLGIGFSAIRDISAANKSGDWKKLSATVKTFRRWVWLTGAFGMITVIILSPWLSKWSLGNTDYTYAFLLLSVILLISAISGGQSAILRGTRRIKETAKAGVWGGALGLVTSIPLYYFYGIKGIIPALIVSALTGLTLSWYYARKVKIEPIDISYKESFQQGKVMIKLGVILTLANIIGQGVSYLLIIFIRETGSVAEVGLYNAGWAITNQYTGMVFAAMAVDYYPRLAEVNTDNIKIKQIVNHQAEIAMLIITPIMLFYLTSLPILIPILLTDEFLSIIPFAQWIVVGMLFKTVSWAMGYISFAKGDSKLFFLLEGVLGNGLQIVAFMTGYYYFGLEGIGIGFLTLYVIYFILITMICRKRYQVSFSKQFGKLFAMQLLFCLIAFLIVYFFKYPTGYISGGLLLIISVVYSYKELNKRIGIREFIQSKLKRNGNE